MASPVVHFEITTDKDAGKIQSFYSNLFGWQIDANNPMDYGMVAAGEGGIGGGISKAPQQMVTVYVAVDDLQAHLDKAEALGGKTVMPVTDIPGAVVMAQFADPDGNIIGMIKA